MKKIRIRIRRVTSAVSPATRPLNPRGAALLAPRPPVPSVIVLERGVPVNHTGPIPRLMDSDLDRLVRFSQGFPTSDAALQGPGGLSKRELLESLRL